MLCLNMARLQSTIIRFHAITAMGKAVTTAKRALTDSNIRDVIKQARSALSDKSFPVVRAACEVSCRILCYTNNFDDWISC